MVFSMENRTGPAPGFFRKGWLFFLLLGGMVLSLAPGDAKFSKAPTPFSAAGVPAGHQFLHLDLFHNPRAWNKTAEEASDAGYPAPAQGPVEISPRPAFSESADSALERSFPPRNFLVLRI